LGGGGEDYTWYFLLKMGYKKALVHILRLLESFKEVPRAQIWKNTRNHQLIILQTKIYELFNYN